MGRTMDPAPAPHDEIPQLSERIPSALNDGEGTNNNLDDGEYN